MMTSCIINGHPWTRDDTALLNDLSIVEQKMVLIWISDRIKPLKNQRYPPRQNVYSAYGLKHIYEHETGIYMTNNQFKDAMLISGYRPMEYSLYGLNWYYALKKVKED